MRTIWEKETTSRKMVDQRLGKNIDQEFMSSLSQVICDSLHIPDEHRASFMALFNTATGDRVRELLEQYLNFYVEVFSGEFRRAFDVVSVDADYDNIPTRKFSPIIKAIKDKMKQPEIIEESDAKAI